MASACNTVPTAAGQAGGVPQLPSPCFCDILRGMGAFYNQPDYIEATKRDFQKDILPTSYAWNTECKIITIARVVFSVIVFPVGLYWLLHALAGKVALLPAANPRLMGYPPNHADISRANIFLGGELKYKRLTIEVDGYAIDAMIGGTPSTLGNGRWILASNGNGEFYEDSTYCRGSVHTLARELHANVLVFNYPGVGASSGLPNRYAMVKAYRAMLSFLEDEKQGLGAKQIIGYGHSLGGGVQGDALTNHELRKGIRYVFVKSRTFSNISSAASAMLSWPLGILVKIFGWNIDSVGSSKALQAPEIILQRARVERYEELHDSAKIISDGVIPADASLAKALLEDRECPRENKLFIGMPERHNDGLSDPSFLGQKIETLLSK